MASPTRDDVWFCMHLYEQRREPVLRAARDWLFAFCPTTFDEIKYVVDGKAGEEANRYWRQATSYWEMISVLMLSGGVTPECRDLFVKTTREFMLCWVKIAPFIKEIRETFRPTAFSNLEAFCRSLPDYDNAYSFFTRMNETMRSRVVKGKGSVRVVKTSSNGSAKKKATARR